jgi:hypothetical protein
MGYCKISNVRFLRLEDCLSYTWEEVIGAWLLSFFLFKRVLNVHGGFTWHLVVFSCETYLRRAIFYTGILRCGYNISACYFTSLIVTKCIFIRKHFRIPIIFNSTFLCCSVDVIWWLQCLICQCRISIRISLIMTLTSLLLLYHM